jgi:hypothetical protein
VAGRDPAADPLRAARSRHRAGRRADQHRPADAAAAHPAPRPGPSRSPRLAAADAVYGYSFIVTNFDVSTAEQAAAVDHCTATARNSRNEDQ